MSRLFSQTLREVPSEAEVVSHRLLLRAGFIRQLAAGIFSYLPLARRSMTKIENIMRDKINALGGQEMTMPVVHPGDLWKETGRWYGIGSELGRFVEKSGRDMALAMTHEEVVTDLTRKEIKSYRQLPQLVYHIQTKWRDDTRPRAGLIRAREFTMLDSYSIDADWEGLDKQYRAHYQAYFDIFNRCALPVIAVKSDVGMMGGSMAHEFMYLTQIGEDTLVLCDACGYSANRQVALFRKAAAPEEEARDMEKVATPGVTTIDALANFLGVPSSKTAKAVFMVAKVSEGEADREQFVFAVVRGDMDVNETKLANVVKAKELRPAHEEEILAIGAQPGYGSPIGVHDALVVVDDAAAQSPNLVAGANEVGYHYINVNYGRDYRADIVADIAAAKVGDACPNCGEPLHLSGGVETGNIFKLGTRYSDALGALFLDKEGKQKAVIMGSYGIGVGRLLACVAEEHNDERGLVWPITIAPYHVHLVSLAKEDGEARDAAERLYREMQSAGIEVLYDDRDGTAGVKFNDADLIGIPLRITVGDRSLSQGGVEMKRRSGSATEIVALDDVIARLQHEIAALHKEIEANIVEVRFEE
ncbi:MAG: proline--tRNA ligase [Chloroflexota bacterium]